VKHIVVNKLELTTCHWMFWLARSSTLPVL